LKYDYDAFIKKSVALKILSSEDINRYLNDGSFNFWHYGKNNIVHYSGDLCSKLELILSGKVVVDRIDESGSIMSIAEFLKDEFLGGNLLFSKNPYYPMTITAKIPTVILEISKERLLNLFSDNHEFLRYYLEFVSDHATILGEKIKHYVNRTIRDSLLDYLENEKRRQGSNIIKLNLTKKALAETIGIQRTSLSRELSKMQKDGLVLFDAHSITILFNS
jgi:CRP-like cAMP-binding protein